MRAARLGAALACGAIAFAGIAAAPLVAPGTTVRLMVLREVSTRTAKPGDRFALLVDQPIAREGATIVPAQAKAWGEVVEAHENGSAGTAGKLAARLLWIELPDGRVPLRGEMRVAGSNGLLQAGAFAVVGGMLAPLALFARGNNARLKAGDIVEGVVAKTRDGRNARRALIPPHRLNTRSPPPRGWRG